jgi:hypothetical protein
MPSSKEGNDNMGEEVGCSEQLLQLLLDVAACAHDIIDWPCSIEPDPRAVGSVPAGEIFSDPVFSLVIAQASPVW